MSGYGADGAHVVGNVFADDAVAAISAYRADVASRAFPDPSHTYS